MLLLVLKQPNSQAPNSEVLWLLLRPPLIEFLIADIGSSQVIWFTEEHLKYPLLKSGPIFNFVLSCLTDLGWTFASCCLCRPLDMWLFSDKAWRQRLGSSGLLYTPVSKEYRESMADTLKKNFIHLLCGLGKVKSLFIYTKDCCCWLNVCNSLTPTHRWKS